MVSLTSLCNPSRRHIILLLVGAGVLSIVVVGLALECYSNSSLSIIHSIPEAIYVSQTEQSAPLSNSKPPVVVTSKQVHGAPESPPSQEPVTTDDIHPTPINTVGQSSHQAKVDTSSIRTNTHLPTPVQTLQLQQQQQQQQQQQRSVPGPALTFSSDGSAFILDGKPLRILSGELHYFRIVPEYWEDRLRRVRAAGLNTVSTYVAWNLHEPHPGRFYFDKGTRTDLRGFIQTAQRLGLLVILRPGPYICAEWEFGGLPAWLLRDHGTEIRTGGPHYLTAVSRFLGEVFGQTKDLQRAYGGPIVAVQLENEYGTYGNDELYLTTLYKTALKGGIVELLFKCDDGQGLARSNLVQLPNVLQTVNSNADAERHLTLLRKNQRVHAPVFVTEFWTGWYSLFGSPFATLGEPQLLQYLSAWLDHGASISFYMWHGGSNFYHNGAIEGPYRVVSSSYDYDSPVSENGTLTSKFFSIRKLLRDKVGAQVVFGEIPAPIPVKAYGAVPLTKYASLDLLASLLGSGISLEEVCPMEALPIHNNGGQAMGWTLYRHTNISKSVANSRLTVPALADIGVILLNGKRLGSMQHKKPATFTLPDGGLTFSTNNTIDILTAHLGRNNYLPTGSAELKGLLAPVQLGQDTLRNWMVFPLEFSRADIDVLLSSSSVAAYAKVPPCAAGDNSVSQSPHLLLAEFQVDGKPCDSYLRVGKGWGSGLVVLNGEILGRYVHTGPQHTLYTPAPLLRSGKNTLVILELEDVPCSPQVEFVAEPILGRSSGH